MGIALFKNNKITFILYILMIYGLVICCTKEKPYKKGSFLNPILFNSNLPIFKKIYEIGLSNKPHIDTTLKELYTYIDHKETKLDDFEGLYNTMDKINEENKSLLSLFSYIKEKVVDPSISLLQKRSFRDQMSEVNITHLMILPYEVDFSFKGSFDVFKKMLPTLKNKLGELKKINKVAREIKESINKSILLALNDRKDIRRKKQEKIEEKQKSLEKILEEIKDRMDENNLHLISCMEGFKASYQNNTTPETSLLESLIGQLYHRGKLLKKDILIIKSFLADSSIDKEKKKAIIEAISIGLDEFTRAKKKSLKERISFDHFFDSYQQIPIKDRLIITKTLLEEIKEIRKTLKKQKEKIEEEKNKKDK